MTFFISDTAIKISEVSGYPLFNASRLRNTLIGDLSNVNKNDVLSFNGEKKEWEPRHILIGGTMKS